MLCSHTPEFGISGILEAHLEVLKVPSHLFDEIVNIINDGLNEDDHFVDLKTDMNKVRIGDLHIIYDKFAPNKAIAFKEVYDLKTGDRELFMTKWIKISGEG